MTEEEREIKNRKEKMEKEKEDYYKRRKNGKLNKCRNKRWCVLSWWNIDLLDNLLDPSLPSGRHPHRSPGAESDIPTHTKPPSLAGSDDLGFVPSSRIVSTERRESKDAGAAYDSPGKDRYLVDVDVDVDGVMMDGLDQVEYYNRLGHDQRDTADGYYEPEGGDGIMMVDSTTGEAEMISRTLDALALEGL